MLRALIRSPLLKPLQSLGVPPKSGSGPVEAALNIFIVSTQFLRQATPRYKLYYVAEVPKTFPPSNCFQGVDFDSTHQISFGLPGLGSWATRSWGNFAVTVSIHVALNFGLTVMKIPFLTLNVDVRR